MDKLRKYRYNARSKNKKIIEQHKARPCTDCGIHYPYYVMSFDHVRGAKSFNIGASRSVGYNKLLEEIAKCDVVCHNCHAIRTWTRKTEIKHT